MSDLRQVITSMGLPEGARVIRAFVGGSGLHGIKLEGKDDTDIYAAFIERPDDSLGLDRLDHFVTSTAPAAIRNRPGDVDVTCYSLRRWAALAVAGNPTVLHYLFAPAGETEAEWRTVLNHSEVFLAKTHARKFIGYADAQLKRMIGLRGTGKHGQRDEFTERFGYDVKAAMHVLRLLLEGIELMREGTITFPRPERAMLLEVRTGKRSQDRVIRDAERLVTELNQATKTSSLSDTVDRGAVSRLVARIYLESWRAHFAA